MRGVGVSVPKNRMEGSIRKRVVKGKRKGNLE